MNTLNIILDVWGFDEEAVKVLHDMKPEETDDLIKQYAILLDENSPLRFELAKDGDVRIICFGLYKMYNFSR